jgi:hypothetical protein
MNYLFRIIIITFILVLSKTQAEDLLKWTRKSGISIISVEAGQVETHQISSTEYDAVAYSSTGKSVLAVSWKQGTLEFDLYHLVDGIWENKQFSFPYEDSKPESISLATTEKAEQYLVICNHKAGRLIWRNRDADKTIYDGKFERKLQAVMITRDRNAVTFFEEVKTEARYQDTAPAIFTKVTVEGQIVSVTKEPHRTERGGAIWPLPAIETNRSTFAFASNYLFEPKNTRQVWEWNGTANSEPTEIKHVFSRSVTSIPGSNDLCVSQKDGLWVYKIPSVGAWVGTLIVPRKNEWLASIHHFSPTKGLVAFRNGNGIWVGKVSDQTITKVAESDRLGFEKLQWVLGAN